MRSRRAVIWNFLCLGMSTKHVPSSRLCIYLCCFKIFGWGWPPCPVVTCMELWVWYYGIGSWQVLLKPCKAFCTLSKNNFTAKSCSYVRGAVGLLLSYWETDRCYWNHIWPCTSSKISLCPVVTSMVLSVLILDYWGTDRCYWSIIRRVGYFIRYLF